MQKKDFSPLDHTTSLGYSKTLGEEGRPIQYVSQTAVPFSERFIEGAEPVQRLGLYIGRAEYPDYGHVMLAEENLVLRLEYQPVPINRDTEYFLRHVPKFRKDRWKLIESLWLSNTVTDISRNLISRLPEGYKVYYRPGEAMGGTMQLIMDNDLMIIQCEGDFAQLRTLVGLSHEIGHAQIGSNDTAQIRNDLMNARKNLTNYSLPPSLEELALVLNDEQQAWTNARKLLEPVLHPPAHQFLTDETFAAEEDRSMGTYQKIADERLGRRKRSL